MQQIEKTLGLGFNVHCFRFLEQIWFNCNYGRMTENAFDPLPLPSGVPVPMCFCGDPGKVAKFDEGHVYADVLDVFLFCV